MYNVNIFGLKASFAELIKSILLSDIIDNNYSKEIICNYIFFYSVTKPISHLKFFNTSIQSFINTFFYETGKKYSGCAVFFKLLFFWLLS